uniref:SSD domain-containing protein n=1 Tax=Steinernema glaseri TaxID=37863 RepID=A0A1I8A4A6_9BILA
MNSVQANSHFDPDDVEAVTADGRFKLTNLTDLTGLASELRRMRRLPFVQHAEKFWPERFLEWSAGVPCERETPCCNVSSPLFFDEYLDHCLRVSTTELFTHFNDTPIYHNETFALVGYTASLSTKLRYSHSFANLSASFELYDENFQGANMWYTTEWTLMSTWFDLLRSIVSDCKQSLAISLAVVAVFALLNLRLMALAALLTIVCVVVVSVGAVVFLGWVIGVLEAVILMLVVGLSFDFTLHYGASIPKEGCRTHRIDAAVRKAFVPVAGAALSSVFAGAVMLLSVTHAFFQVGVFLCVSTSVSWLYSTFFFLPLLSLTLWPAKTDCKLCRQTVFPAAIAMKQYAQ